MKVTNWDCWSSTSFGAKSRNILWVFWLYTCCDDIWKWSRNTWVCGDFFRKSSRRMTQTTPGPWAPMRWEALLLKQVTDWNISHNAHTKTLTQGQRFGKFTFYLCCLTLDKQISSTSPPQLITSLYPIHKKAEQTLYLICFSLPTLQQTSIPAPSFMVLLIFGSLLLLSLSWLLMYALKRQVRCSLSTRHMKRRIILSQIQLISCQHFILQTVLLINLHIRRKVWTIYGIKHGWSLIIQPLS